MFDEVLFSIVVPTYNRAHLIGKTLDSLLLQSWPRWEILVIDDGSTDDTESVVKGISHPRIQYFKKENAERAAARNYGAARARGDYVNFFDSDDLALPNHLAEAARMARARKTPEWFHLGFAVTTPTGKILDEVNNFQGETLQQYIPRGNPLSCNGVFIRKDIIQKHPFNEDRSLSASEDYELWYRLAARYPLHYSNQITSLVVEHENRSVHKTNGQKLISRIKSLRDSLARDQVVVEVFREQFRLTEVNLHTHLALHLAEDPCWKTYALVQLGTALLKSPAFLFKRRFLIIIRNLLLKW